MQQRGGGGTSIVMLVVIQVSLALLPLFTSGFPHPPSPFFKNVSCVRETEILAEKLPPSGVFIRDHAVLVINKLFLLAGSAVHIERGVLLPRAPARRVDLRRLSR